MYTLQKYILVFLLLGSALAFNPFITTDVFEFPKLLVLIFGVGFLTIINVIDVMVSLSGNDNLKNISFDKLRMTFSGLLGLLFIGALLAFLFSIDRSRSFAGAPERFQGFLTQVHYILLALNTFYFFSRHPREKTESIFHWLLIALVIACAFALLPFVFPLVFPFYLATPAFFFDRVYGTFGNPNYLASFIVTTLPFLIFSKILLKPKRFHGIFFWLFLILVITTLFYTGSRSAWIAAFMGFLLWGIVEIVREKKWKTFIITLSVVLLFIAISGAKNYFSEAVPQFSRLSFDTPQSTSFQTRLYLWEAGFKLFLKRPITGFGQEIIKDTIEPYLPDYLKTNDLFFIDRTHSEFIDVLVTQGIIGFIGYVGFFAFVWFSSVSGMLKPAFIGFTILILFHSVNFSTISSNVLLYFFAGYLGSLQKDDLFQYAWRAFR